MWAPLFGAALLALTDQLAQIVTFAGQEVPAGAATGFLGGPLLIWLVTRTRAGAVAARDEIAPTPRLGDSAQLTLLICGLAVLVIGVALALAVGRTPEGWRIASWPEFELLSPWRTPRVFVAMAAGAMLAAAGVLIQRMTGNLMASPELLGVSTSRAIGLNVGAARMTILLLTASATAAATLIVGPLSFVGLMSPHIARMLGFQRPLGQLFSAAIVGAFIMVFADWLGRNLLFPWQAPAALLATLVGGPYLMVLLRGRPRV